MPSENDGARAATVAMNSEVREMARVTEERLRLATESANIGTWDWDLETNVLFWDTRCRAAFGYPRDLPIDYPACLALVHPDDRATTDQAVKAALAPGGTGNYIAEFRVRGFLDDVERWVIVTGKAFFNEDGTRPTRFVGTIQDISDRKRTEEALRRVEDQFRDAHTRLDAALLAGEIATWTFDIVNNRVVADPNLAHLFSVDPTAAAGGELSVYLNAIHESDRDRVSKHIAEVIQSGDSFESEYRVVLPDGSPRWLVARGKVKRDGDGNATTLPGVVVDVTARHEASDALARSESRFRLQADAMPQMVWATDKVGNHLYYNRRWYDYTGQTVEESMGFGFALALHPDDVERTLERWRLAWQDGADYDIEYRFRRYDGTYRWFVGRAEPIRDPDTGEVTMWAGTCTDIDDFKKTQAELAVALEKNSRIAETLQNAMLLAPPSDAFFGLTVGTHYEAAWEEAQIGGDFFDTFSLDDGMVAFVVGDSTGKGLEAARHVSELQFVLRAYLRENAHPAMALERLNNYLVDGQRLDTRAENSFAAVIVAVVNSRTGATRVAAGGAEPPLLIRADTGKAEEIPAYGVVLGANPKTSYDDVRVSLEKGDVLVLTTDGVTEARNRETRDFFGYEGFVAAVEAEAIAAPNVKVMAKNIASRAKSFAGGQLNDDVCLLVIQCDQCDDDDPGVINLPPEAPCGEQA